MITGNTWEETILKNGTPAVNVNSDRTHLYIILTGWGTHRHGQVCCFLLQMAKSVMKSELSKRGLLTRR